jgi:glucose-1-phosphate adenylyltransferase
VAGGQEARDALGLAGVALLGQHPQRTVEAHAAVDADHRPGLQPAPPCAAAGLATPDHVFLPVLKAPPRALQEGHLPRLLVGTRFVSASIRRRPPPSAAGASSTGSPANHCRASVQLMPLNTEAPHASTLRQMNSDPRRELMRQAYAVVLAGGRGSRLHQLTDHRAKPAVPFAGTMRIVDFALGNCVNSGLRRIAVLTQYKSQSLIRHVERSWGFLESSLGEFVDVVPAQQQLDDQWYTGTANAVFQNLDILRESQPQHVVMLGGDHVYKMDYAVMLAEHVARGAQLSVACIEVSVEDACGFGVMAVDDAQRIVAFEEKPARPTSLPGLPGRALASMGIYVFDADFLFEQLARDAADPASSHDFGHDLVPWLVGRARVFAHRFESSCVNMVGDRPYWRDVGTLDAYWEANIDLTHVVPELNLYDEAWPMLGRQPHRPPAKFVFDEPGRRGVAVDSLVSGGCIVSGAVVRRSILFHDVHVGEGSVVEDSVVLPGVKVGCGVRLQRAVVDKGCVLPDGFVAGGDPARDRERFRVTERGITLITPAMLAG